MDGLQAVVRGAAIGLFVAAPVGPNAALCIRRTLSQGRVAGVRSGLAVALVHALYAGLALGGAGGMSGWMAEHRTTVRLVGGVVLFGLGLRLAGERRPAAAAGTRQASTLVVGLTNPLTLLTFTAVAAAGAGAASPAPLTVAGVFTGSALWWVVLASVVSMVGRRLSDAGVHRVNRLSAVTLACFGLAAMASAT